MKRKPLIIGSALTLVTAAALAAGFFSRSDKASTSDQPTPASPQGQSAGELEWHTDVDAAIEKARTEGKPVFIDFYANWCPPCKMMEKTTFQDDQVKARLQDFTLVKVDVDKAGDVAQKYGVQSLPTLMCVKPEGSQRIALGYQSPEKLQKLLGNCAGANAAGAKVTQ